MKIKSEQLIELVRIIKMKCRVEHRIYSAIASLYDRFGDKVCDAVDDMPLAHHNPIGYIMKYCGIKRKSINSHREAGKLPNFYKR